MVKLKEDLSFSRLWIEIYNNVFVRKKLKMSLEFQDNYNRLKIANGCKQSSVL